MGWAGEAKIAYRPIGKTAIRRAASSVSSGNAPMRTAVSKFSPSKMTEVQFIYAEGLNMGADAVQQGVAEAEAQMAALA